MFGVMWSEHCAYKHSKAALRRFPSRGRGLLRGPGENAGAVSVGDGWAAVFKMESHNHPSAVAPFHGAATGVGGIIRDILAMGARPIALLDSLRFGPPEDRAVARSCTASSRASRRTATASGCRRSAASSSARRATGGTRSSTSRASASCARTGSPRPGRPGPATRSSTWVRGPAATACRAPRSHRPNSRATRRTAPRCRWATRSRASS